MIVIGAGMTFPSMAQKVADLTDEQVQQFIQQAKASGLSEAQIEQLALSRGFSPTDITKMRQRISDLNTKAPTEPVRDQAASRTQSDESPVASTGRHSTGRQTFGYRPGVVHLRRFFFTNANLTFEPNLRIPTPKNYQLGPDDELIVDIYGNAQQTYRTKINPEGTIRLENLSPIYVNGLTVEQAEQRIVVRLRQLYTGLNTAAGGVHAQVSLGNIRSIKVTLIGQVVKPGTYTLSSLGTVFNALYAAGGPDPSRGSFRDIRVYRAKPADSDAGHL